MEHIEILKNRIYSDFLMPSRMSEYESLLKDLLEHEYNHSSVRDYCKLMESKDFKKGKYFVNKHDIDTDLNTAKKFFEIEKKLNVKATYYFRLSTLDFGFMKEIEEYGSEASYHYEEIAQYCKDNHIKTKDMVLKNIENINNLFIRNFLFVENNLGKKLKTISSHGDFVNRKLKIQNKFLLENNVLIRNRLGIECEAYDENFMKSFDIYISDKPYPIYFSPIPLKDAIRKYDRIYLLTHPRQWQANVKINMIDNLKRLYEGIKW